MRALVLKYSCALSNIIIIKNYVMFALLVKVVIIIVLGILGSILASAHHTSLYEKNMPLEDVRPRRLGMEHNDKHIANFFPHAYTSIGNM